MSLVMITLFYLSEYHTECVTNPTNYDEGMNGQQKNEKSTTMMDEM